MLGYLGMLALPQWLTYPCGISYVGNYGSSGVLSSHNPKLMGSEW